MRTFTNYSQPFNIKPNITLTISATGVNTLYKYLREDILDISNIDWEMPFTGGLAKTSDYRINLSNELSAIKDQLPNLIGAAIQIEVEVNSNVFYPHVGRIRSYVRDGFDPNQIEIEVFDRFFDDNQHFPKELITDSWDTVHPEELLSGYPVYYGRHHRPFYHTAVASDVAILLGARNVSSENHVNSVWYNSNFDDGLFTDGRHVLLVNKDWNQQSGNTNLIDGGEFFEVKDISEIDIRIWNYNGLFPLSTVAPDHLAKIQFQEQGNIKLDITSHGGISTQRAFVRIKPEFRSIFKWSRIKGSVEVGSGNFGTGNAIIFDAHAYENSGTVIHQDTIAVNGFTTSQSRIISFDKDTTGFSGTNVFLNGNTNNYLLLRVDEVNGDYNYMAMSLQFNAQLRSEAYQNYSIFSPIVNSADIAISENPQLIVEDILNNHLSIPFIQEQSSQSQVDVQSYNFQCFFKERQLISDILNEFGRITQTNMWVGDSGAMNFRTFKESGNETVNTSFSQGSILQRTLSIIEAPVGSSIYDQDLVSKITVGYNYNFQQALFNNKLVADKFNTAECDSLDSIGITGERIEETKFTLQSDTASFYLGNLVRKYSNANEFVKFSGGAELFPLEVGDIFHLENPIIVGSAANYQIIKLSTNYVKGTTQITGARLKN